MPDISTFAYPITRMVSYKITIEANSVRELLGRLNQEVVKCEGMLGKSDYEVINNRAICPTCYSPAEEVRGISAKGRSYHAIFCYTDNKDHTKWIKD